MEDLFNKKIERKNSSAIKWDYQENKDNLPFWIADSDYMTAPCVIEALHEVSNHGVYGYNMVPDEFKDAVIYWYKTRYNTDVKPEWIIPFTGVILELRVLLSALVKNNEKVILQTPVYHTFYHLLDALEIEIVENKLIKENNTYLIDYENLEELFKEGHKFLLMCSPHNPVGRLWTEEEIEKVVKLAKKYNAIVIFDEIHSDLNISGRPFISGLRFVEEYDNIVVCNAPSKTFNIAGLHVSYIIIPNEKIKEKFISQKDKEFLGSPSVFGYQATIAAYTKGAEWVDAQLLHLERNYKYLEIYLELFLSKVVVTKLEATYLVWLDFSYTNLNSEQLMKKLNDAGVTCSKGVAFGKDYESFVRFNIACPSKQLLDGLMKIAEAFLFKNSISQ